LRYLDLMNEFSGLNSDIVTERVKRTKKFAER
jgi:hypothetical protein